MWQIIPDAPIEEQTIDLLVDPAPVSEKGNTGVDALITDTARPIPGRDRLCSGPVFSPSSHRVDAWVYSGTGKSVLFVYRS